MPSNCTLVATVSLVMAPRLLRAGLRCRHQWSEPNASREVCPSWTPEVWNGNVSEMKRVGSTTSWQWPLIVSIALPALLNMVGYAPQKGFVSFDLIVTGAGFLLSGLLIWFVALPRVEPSSREESDRTIEWHRGAFVLMPLDALIGGNGIIAALRKNGNSVTAVA
jgi:hypothetical protein